MVGYSKKLYSHSNLGLTDVLTLSSNIALLAIFYTFLGGFVSFIFYYIFDEYGPDDEPPRNKEWENLPAWFQILDVSVEVVIIALISFWITFTINTSAPIFPVRSDLSSYVDTYTTGMFFMYTVFLFTSDLTSKLIFLYNNLLGKQFDTLFPNAGSILTLNLHYAPRKTNETKNTE
jgi:hypothetical protein